MFNLAERIDPAFIKQWRSFCAIRRGFWSFVILAVFVGLSLCAELFFNSRPLILKYDDHFYFPIFSGMVPGKTFGLDYEYETNYRQLEKKMYSEEHGFILMPFVPYNPFENDLVEGQYPPLAPNFEARHFLGTDSSGRDILARIVYGFRISLFFAALVMVGEYGIGVFIGCLMGYWGGRFDMILQRLIEIWYNVPFLYLVIIVSSIITPNFWSLIGIILVFDWINMTWYLRTATYKEKSRDYVTAAQAMGMSTFKIITREIIPNTLSLIITFVPFSLSGAIVSLTTLDFLGFGLPPPTPSWGELLSEGMSHLQSPWIVISVSVAMIFILTMVTFVGEAVRDAFDPKKFIVYE